MEENVRQNALLMRLKGNKRVLKGNKQRLKGNKQRLKGNKRVLMSKKICRSKNKVVPLHAIRKHNSEKA